MDPMADFDATITRLRDDDPSLEHLEFSGSSKTLDDKKAVLIADALSTNTVVNRIDFSSNVIGEYGITAIANSLKHNTTVTQFSIYYNNRIGYGGIKSISSAVRINASLVELCISGCQMDDDGIQTLSTALHDNESIMELYLHFNEIADEGVQFLANALRDNTTLTDLSLSNNQIGDVGALYIAEVLHLNNTLCVLDVSYNQIGNDGARFIADALKVNKSLATLGLASNNQLTSVGAKAIAEALKVNTALKELQLDDNDIDDDGGRAFLEALESWNDTITFISLATISKSLRRRLDALLDANQTGNRVAPKPPVSIKILDTPLQSRHINGNLQDNRAIVASPKGAARYSGYENSAIDRGELGAQNEKLRIARNMLFNLNLDMEVVATATGLTRDEITMLIEEVGAQEEKFKIARNMLFNLHLESQIVVEATGLSVEAVLDLTPSSSGS